MLFKISLSAGFAACAFLLLSAALTEAQLPARPDTALPPAVPQVAPRIDLSHVKTIRFADGWKAINYHYNETVPLEDWLRVYPVVQADAIGQDNWDAEKNRLMRIALQEIGGNFLGKYQDGKVFWLTPIEEILKVLDDGILADLRFQNVFQVQTNFEQSGAPLKNGKGETSGTTFEKAFPDAEHVSITGVHGPIKGKSMTLRALYDSPYWNEEAMQRVADRMVAIHELIKARKSPTTRVCSGDLSFFAAFAQYGTFGDAYLGKSRPPEYLRKATFPDFQFRNVNLTSGKSMFDIADCINIYNYPFFDWMVDRDFNDIFTAQKSGTQTLEYIWSKLHPDKLWDITVPGSIILNRRTAAALGRKIPVGRMSHYRLEDGYACKVSTKVTPFLTDECICSPKTTYAELVWGRMAGLENDYMMWWSTIKRIKADNPIDHRPMDDQAAIVRGLETMAGFAAYFDPKYHPILHVFEETYLRYPDLKGGDFGQAEYVKKDGDYCARMPFCIADGNNREDPRTRVACMTRTIRKNGSRYVLVVASNFRQAPNQLSKFDLKVDGVEVVGQLEVAGDGVMIKEINLDQKPPLLSR